MKNNTQQRKMGMLHNKVLRNAVIACAGVAIITGSAFLLPLPGKEEESKAEAKKQGTEEAAVEIPAIELTEENAYGLTIPLFNYKGKIYTLSDTRISSKDAQSVLMEKVGTTKDNLDDWSEEWQYQQELASTIGVEDVFTVKGYDPEFRLMTLNPIDGARFYEQLNGITITSGKDIFAKLNMEGNAVRAKYQTFTEWNSSANLYQEIEDQKTLNRFIGDLIETKPFRQSTSIMPMNDNTMTDEGFREVIVQLKDGSKVHMFVLKHGFVYYNGIYFKMEKNKMMDFWNHLDE